MNAASLPMPGTLWGRYPERRPQERMRARPLLSARRYHMFVARVIAIDLQSASDEQLTSQLVFIRQRLVLEGFADDAMVGAFAVVREIAARALSLRLHPVQIFAARAMLEGRLAEMGTGEGKTLAAALAAAIAALARVPVHVVTVNDYLARRDGEALRPLFTRLGLAVGVVTQESDFEARCAAYARDVTYCSSKELVFDYLRDSLARNTEMSELCERLATSPRVRLRGLCMAVIDEADSVLLDEARVPFVLSRPHDNAASCAHYDRALALATRLLPEDFVLHPELRSAELTVSGRTKAEAIPGDALWNVQRFREEAVVLALSALHLFHRDRDYLVRGGAVQVIDANTGRVAPGRAWSRGLHQLIELKEGLKASRALETAAQITYQRFFSRYVRLCGMSGTLTEGKAELERVYGLTVVRVPLRTLSRRMVLPTRVFADEAARWRFVVQRVQEFSSAGRPVLVGTDSVADSQALSAKLQAAGLAHAVLNARHDKDEASVITRAGLRGRVTVATNMAGRGTDIELDESVARRGGLHVILCQANASARIDRQFLGRGARRGQPGSCETLYSVDVPALRICPPARLCTWTSADRELRPRWVARFLVYLALLRERRRQDSSRIQLWKQDRDMDHQPVLGGST